MQDIIIEYYRNPINNYKPSTYTIEHTEGNTICGDSITIYLTLSHDKKIIEELHFDGDTSQVTTAAASFLADLIKGNTIDTIMKRDYDKIKAEGFEVSHKRKRAAIIALLAIQNAIIRKYNIEKRTKKFEDLIHDL